MGHGPNDYLLINVWLHKLQPFGLFLLRSVKKSDVLDVAEFSGGGGSVRYRGHVSCLLSSTFLGAEQGFHDSVLLSDELDEVKPLARVCFHLSSARQQSSDWSLSPCLLNENHDVLARRSRSDYLRGFQLPALSSNFFPFQFYSILQKQNISCVLFFLFRFFYSTKFSFIC